MFVLTIDDDEYGMIAIELFDTQEKAKAYLARWCRKMYEGDIDAEDDDAAIEIYFADQIDAYDIQYKEPNPTR